MTSSCISSLACLLALAIPGVASAHPFAVSHFDARTEGDRLAVTFRLDAISVDDLADRDAGPLLDYLDARFAVTNGGEPCPRAATTERRDTRVHVNAVYQCGAELGVLAIESTLFLDEPTPHRVLGTLRHGGALERYLFGRSERTVRVELGKLRQAGRSYDTRQFRTATPPPGAFSQPAPQAPAPAGFTSFVGQGVTHVLGGLDHVLFVACLVLGVRRFRELVFVISAFTAAHSITLVLGGLGLVYVSPAIVEPAIAASIVYAALVRDDRHRLGVVFAFGLMHGFGFSGALHGLGLSAGETVPLLLGLNVGVELAQLLIVAPLWPLVLLLQRQPRADRYARAVASVAVAGLACVWLVQRVV